MKTKPNKTLVYIIENFPSPTEYFILNEIIELEKAGVDLVVIALRKQKKYLDRPEIKKLKSTVIYLPKILWYFPFIVFFLSPFAIISIKLPNAKALNPNSLKKLRNTCIGYFLKSKLKTRNIHHIHAHFAFIAVDIAQILSKIIAVNYSFTAHAQDIYLNCNRLPDKIDSASFVITCTDYNKNFINKITNNEYVEKIFRIYHGIDLKKWEINSKRYKVKDKNDQIQILTVARLVEKKGLIYLLKAIKILKDNQTKVNCLIIGEGPLKKELINYIKISGIQDQVKIIPFLTQIELKKYYSKAEIFILPCVLDKNGDRDGLPNVLLEAIIAGIPVITTNISAIPEIIINMKTGILIQEKDETSIANAILKLKYGPGLYNSIVENGIKAVEKHFSIDLCIEELKQILLNTSLRPKNEKNNSLP